MCEYKEEEGPAKVPTTEFTLLTTAIQYKAKSLRRVASLEKEH